MRFTDYIFFQRIKNYLKLNKADYLFVSAPENVAWLLNIRGYDNPNSPIPNARLIINKNKKIFLIAKKNNLKKIIKEKIIAINLNLDKYLILRVIIIAKQAATIKNL